MVCLISFVSDLIRDLMARTNIMRSVLRLVEHTIVLTDYKKKWSNWDVCHIPPYYTHSHGYKMCVSVDFCEICEESALQVWSSDLIVYSYLLRGEYDAGLKWPFRGTVVVQLLNQLSDDNHYDYVFDYSRAIDRESQRVTSGERSARRSSSTPNLPFATLEYNPSKKCQYLKDDCLKFRVFVENL